MDSARAAITRPSATTWSPGSRWTASPTTTWLTGSSAISPSRQARALGAASRESRSSVRLARTSWKIPIAVLATITPPKRASRGSPKTSTSTSSVPRMRLNTVKVFDQTMSR